MRSHVILAATASLAACSLAAADLYTWNWNVGDGGAVSNAAGAFESVQASYDSASHIFSWTVTFSDKKADGITLAVSEGPNPKGHAGELAILYFDAVSLASPKLTAYGYNGTNSSTSWSDGDGSVIGNQTPDRIKSKDDTSWILAISAQDVGTKRIFSFTIDATDINVRSSVPYAGSEPWKGVRFASQLGLWMHAYDGLSTAYRVDGFLKSWSRSKEGWFDGSFFDTETSVVPLPAAAWLGLGGLGALLTARRLRR
jgi:hypothetical protein